jgi:methylmalonyl-CoA mutase N-terminal domain/subunit
VFARVDELGAGSMLDGAVRGVEEGWFQSEIADSAYELERKLNAGRHVIVGVTQFLEGNDEAPPETLRIGPEVEEEQRRRVEKVRRDRDASAVTRTLERVRADAAEPTTNLMPALLDAVRAYATLGEIVDALASVFGRWVAQPRI